jgi:Tfp pilus assembly protein PilO
MGIISCGIRIVAAISETKTDGKSSIGSRLPRLSTTVWILIIACLVLIAMIPLAMGYLEQAANQQALKLQIIQLQSRYDALKAKMASQPSLTDEVGKLKSEAETAKLAYQEVAYNPEVSQVIMDLAWDNDVTITTMRVSSAKNKILTQEYPVLVYSLSMTGQVVNFQNFLRAIGQKLPSSEYTSITITPAAVEGELDSASMSVRVYCNN